MQLPATAKWFGFDLDDTLHSFRKASGQAAAAVFAYLGEEFGCEPLALGTAYAAILKDAQKTGFAGGKTSREYRAERFEALFGRFSIIPYRHLDLALDIYDEALAQSLELKEGAAETLRKLKLSGWPVMVVSEGPHDAQETTLHRLGIASYVDLLVTSSKEGVTKQGGLFERALSQAACPPDGLVFTGDSVENDIVPAAALGIGTVYIGPETALPPGVPRITSLLELERAIPGAPMDDSR